MRLALFLLMILASGQDKPPKDPPAAAREPVFQTLRECELHHLQTDFEKFSRQGPEAGTVTSDACPFDDALRRSKAWLGSAADPKSVAALKDDPAAKTVAGLIGLAGAAVASGRSPAAIAALLEAAAREPSNPSVLANLAAALTTVGLCAEAVAIADAALAQAGEKRGAMGIPLAAVALNAKGYALLRQGKAAEAVKPLRDAIALAGPLAAEAEINLAMALQKTGEEEESKKFFLMRCWRRPIPQPLCYGGKKPKAGDPLPGPYDRNITTRAPIAKIFDVSRGLVGKFPAFGHPHTLKEFNAFKKFYEREMKAATDFRLQLFKDVQEHAREPKGKTLGDWRDQQILHYIGTLNVDPDIAPLWEAREKGREELDRKIQALRESGAKKFLEILKAGGKDLDAKLRAHTDEMIASIHPAANDYDTIARKYWDGARKYSSALASHIGLPYWHRQAVLDLRAEMWTRYAEMLTSVFGAYAAALSVGGGTEKEEGKIEAADKPGPNDPDPDKCSGAMKGTGVEFSAGPLSVSFSCESLGVEIASEGFLKGFASFETTWDGKMTAYAGAKLEVGGTGPLPGFTAHDGIYITGDKTGVTDAGFRVGFEAFHEEGGVKLKTSLDQMDFSLMPRVK